MVFEPEEHDLLEVSLSCFEKRLQFVQFRKLDYLKDLTRVLYELKHGQIV